MSGSMKQSPSSGGIYKGKGDKSICGNSRGISLLAVAGKVLAKVMLHRLVKNITEELLPETQCGSGSSGVV